MGFCQWAEMGPKVGHKWVFGCKSGSKWVKTHFCTHFKPILADFHENPLFTQFKGGGNCFLKNGPEAVPTQHNSGEVFSCSEGSLLFLVDVSDVLYLFCLGGWGKGESEGPGGGGGCDFSWKIPRRGGSPGRWGRGVGRVFEGNFGGGGAKYFFFRGRNSYQVFF